MGAPFATIGFGSFIERTNFQIKEIDLPIPGRRGGTLRSRHYGKVEAVSPEAKHLAEQEAQRLGISTHEWLDRAIRSVATSR